MAGRRKRQGGGGASGVKLIVFSPLMTHRTNGIRPRDRLPAKGLPCQNLLCIATVYAYALGAEVENHVDVPVSIDILQGRPCRSGLCASGAKADCAGFDCGGIKGGRRQNGHWRHSPTLGVDAVWEAARLDVNRNLELRRKTATLVAR